VQGYEECQIRATQNTSQGEKPNKKNVGFHEDPKRREAKFGRPKSGLARGTKIGKTQKQAQTWCWGGKIRKNQEIDNPTRTSLKHRTGGWVGYNTSLNDQVASYKKEGISFSQKERDTRSSLKTSSLVYAIWGQAICRFDVHEGALDSGGIRNRGYYTLEEKRRP